MANTSQAQAALIGGQTMNADAAKYFNALVNKIKAETGISIVATEGTRSYARQKQLYDGYIQGRIDPTTGKRYNPAWSPNDSRANHLSGRAVDVGSGVGYVNTEAAKAWRARAGAYGFRETVPGEPWHFEWQQSWATADLNPPAPVNDEEEDMKPVLIRNNTPNDPNYGSVDVVDITTGYWWHTPSQAYIDFVIAQNLVNHAAGKPWDKPANEWAWYRDRAQEHINRIAAKVWTTPVEGWNGTQNAGTRLQSIDQKSGS